MKAHLERLHGLALYLPEQTKEDWVKSQCRALANRYAEAQLDKDNEKATRLYDSLTRLFYNHQDILSTGDINRALERARAGLEARNR